MGRAITGLLVTALSATSLFSTTTWDVLPSSSESQSVRSDAPGTSTTSSTTTENARSSSRRFQECPDRSSLAAAAIQMSPRTNIPQVLEDAYLKLDAYLDQHAPLKNNTPWKESRPQGVAATKLQGVKVNFLWHSLQEYQNHDNPCNTVCEVGINAGHSSLLWLEACPNSHAILFDLPYKKWSGPTFEYLQHNYGHRVEIIEGNSTETVPQYLEDHPQWQCDVIAIDGSKDPKVRLQDLQQFQKVASHPNTMLLLDDASYEVMQSDYLAANKNSVAEALKEEHDLNALYSALMLTNYIELDGACSFPGALNQRQNSSLAGHFLHLRSAGGREIE